MQQQLEGFKLEEYLAPREFSAKHMFCSSDLQSRSVGDIFKMLTEEERADLENLWLGYTPTEGSDYVRKDIAETYSGLNADDVLCFAGAEEAIYIASKVFLHANDHAITVTPCYQSLQSVAQTMCPVTSIPLEMQNNSWNLNLEKLASAIQPNTKLMFVNFPHNPTGFIPSREVFQQVINLAKQHNIILFCDEVYRGIELSSDSRLPSACELYENAISLGVMSKSYGFAGLRIGWVASRNHEFLTRMNRYKHYLSICNSAPSEWLTHMILKHRAPILEQNNALVKQNYLKLKQYFLSRSDLFLWLEPVGGCTAYPKYLGPEKIADVADKLLNEKGVVILPCTVYGQDNQHFRVGFGRNDFDVALGLFSEFFSKF